MDKFVVKQTQSITGRLCGMYVDAVYSALVLLRCMLESVGRKIRCCQKPLLETHYTERESKNIF